MSTRSRAAPWFMPSPPMRDLLSRGFTTADMTHALTQLTKPLMERNASAMWLAAELPAAFGWRVTSRDFEWWEGPMTRDEMRAWLNRGLTPRPEQNSPLVPRDALWWPLPGPSWRDFEAGDEPPCPSCGGAHYVCAAVEDGTFGFCMKPCTRCNVNP